MVFEAHFDDPVQPQTEKSSHSLADTVVGLWDSMKTGVSHATDLAVMGVAQSINDAGGSFINGGHLTNKLENVAHVVGATGVENSLHKLNTGITDTLYAAADVVLHSRFGTPDKEVLIDNPLPPGGGVGLGMGQDAEAMLQGFTLTNNNEGAALSDPKGGPPTRDELRDLFIKNERNI